jgi:hypothetical protein
MVEALDGNSIGVLTARSRCPVGGFERGPADVMMAPPQKERKEL